MLAEPAEAHYYVDQRAWPNRLTFPVWPLCSAQPLGSPSGEMSNKITKLLILVVPRRTAGAG
jgi:hypothetical protein